MTQLKPALISADNKFVINPGGPTDQVLVDYIPIADLISTDAGQTMSVGTDNKLLTTGEVTCTFKMTDILSEEAENNLTISNKDGKLFYDGDCDVNVSGLVSGDSENSIKFGTDGKLWVDGSLDCEINIGQLLSTEQGNSVKLSLVDGKLFARLEEAECEINIGGLRSTKLDNMLTVNTDDGLLYVRPYDCQFDLTDMVSSDIWNRLRLKTEAGGDGMFLVLSEEQVSSIANNRLKAHMTGDHKFYVIPSDLISADTRSGLELGADGNIKVKPSDLNSTASDSGLIIDSDGKLTVDWSVILGKLFGSSQFQLVNSNRLPDGGTWAYIKFHTKLDEDVEGDHYMSHVEAVGTDAGGEVVGDTYRPWGSNPGYQMVVWRIA